LQAALERGEALVRNHSVIRDAIAEAQRELSKHKEKTGLMELNLCGAESARALGRIEQAAVTEAQAGFAKAAEARQACERRLSGLRAKLIETENEQALKAAADELERLRVPVIVSAMTKAKERISERMAALADVVRDARAIETAAKTSFVDSLLSVHFPRDGRPLVTLPPGAVAVGLPGPVPAAGVSDPVLGRLVAVEAGLGQALGSIAAERNRQAKERYRATRGPGLFPRRPARHDFIVPAGAG
jgi:hypothetical protein